MHNINIIVLACSGPCCGGQGGAVGRELLHRRHSWGQAAAGERS